MVALEAQLNASVRMQIESTREGIQRLGASQERLRAIGDSLGQITKLCLQSDSLIDNYPTIKQVSRTCQNFRLIRSVYDQFTHLDETVARTAALLEEDKQGETSENLLLVYYHLHRLEAFRTQTLALMKDAPSTTMYTLKRYFKKLDDLSAEFEGFYWTIPDRFYSLAITGRQKVIVRWAKILSRMDRALRNRLTSMVAGWIEKKFAPIITEANWGDLETTLQSVGFWLGDLTTIRDGIVPCFPLDMSMMDFYALTFHHHIHTIFSRCLAVPEGASLQAGDILFLLRWVKDYHDKMSSEIGVPVEDLEPALLDGPQESALIRQYLEIARGKISEWIGNLYETERTAFITRPSEPDVDASNFFISPAAVDLIQIIKQHITTTSESGQGKLVLEVINDTVKIVLDFQKKIGKLVEAETERYLAKPDQVPPHFEYYLIMMGNTGLRWATSLQTEIIDALESMIAPEYLTGATKAMKSLSEGFVTIGKQSSANLCRIIGSPITPAIQQLFTAAWYGQVQLTANIMATYGDFFQEYKEHCEEFLMAKLVADVLESFLLAYINQLRSKNTRIKTASCQEYFENDLKETLEFFSTWRDPRRVQKALEALQRFVSLITSSQKMVYLEFFAFWKIFPDMPLALFEEVLSKRDDMDRSAVKDIMETCQKKTLEERPTDIQPSIFSKIKIVEK